MENIRAIKIQRAIDPLKGFKSNNRLTKEQAKKFYDVGYRFCLRGFYTVEGLTNQSICNEEMFDILDSGLSLMPVLHVNDSNWFPSVELARKQGHSVVNQARALGMPAGTTIWCDLTGFNNEVRAQDMIIYCNHWYDAVIEGGYIPGLFVNQFLPLSGNQLFSYINFGHYCRDGEGAPSIPELGYELFKISDIEEIENKVTISQYELQLNQAGMVANWLIQY